MQGHFIKIYFRAELSEAQCGEWMHLGGSGFTSAGASIRRHGVSIFGTCALVTPGDVHTLIGAQLADALRTLVDVLGGGGGHKEEANHVRLMRGLVRTHAWYQFGICDV